MEEKGWEMNEDTGWLAGLGGSTDVLAFLRGKGYKFDDGPCQGAARGGHEAPGPGEAAKRGPRQVDLGADFPQPLEREIESTLAYPILSGEKRTGKKGA